MPRPKRIYVRLSDDERDAVEERAAALDMTISGYFRLVAALPVEFLGAQGTPRIGEGIVGIDNVTWSRIQREALHWGNNYNQGVRALNTIALKAGEVLPDKKERDELLRLAALSLKALDEARDGINEVAMDADAVRESAHILVPISMADKCGVFLWLCQARVAEITPTMARAFQGPGDGALTCSSPQPATRRRAGRPSSRRR